MSQLTEIIPLIGFFIAYKAYDIYAAVIVLMILMTLGVIYTKICKKPITNMQIISWLLVIVFGAITLLFRDEIFIKWKPTVLNWGFAIAFLLSQFFGKENFTQRIMSAAKIEAPKKIWSRLNYSWILFFIVSGALNLFVAYNFDTEVWVNFKLFGFLGLTLLFGLGQAVYLRNYFVK